MNNFEVIIGIEVHTALNTKTKMFSATSTNHKAPVNLNINEVDLAHPGALPTVNKQAVFKGLFLANALNMKTNHHYIAFDRKHYYYLDLPKGFQITQQQYPIGYDGFLNIKCNDQTKKVRINRIHLEEDTAKQTGIENRVLLDYNRAGWPLIEIVTEPDLRSPEEAVAYLEELRKILLFNDISDAKLEDGSMRADVNISIRLYGDNKFGTKVEIKNINSISNVAKAINYEIKRQTNLILTNQSVEQQTRRYDDQSNRTIYMRSKNDAVNYRYISEPNIAPISLSDDFLNNLLASKGISIDQVRANLVNDGMNSNAVEQLLADWPLYKAFSFVNNIVKSSANVYKWVCLELLGLINKQNQTIDQIDEEKLIKIARMVQLFNQTLINGKQTKIILEKIYLTNKDPEVLIKELGFEQITDKNQLTDLLKEIINNNQTMIDQYNERPDRVEKFIMGELMKKTKAQANPTISFEILKQLLLKQ